MQPIIFITVGYIVGIIWGLYLNTSIAPVIFFIIGAFFLFLKKSRKLIKYKYIITIMGLIAIISNAQIMSLEKKFDKLYFGKEEIKVTRNYYRKRKRNRI